MFNKTDFENIIWDFLFTYRQFLLNGYLHKRVNSDVYEKNSATWNALLLSLESGALLGLAKLLERRNDIGRPFDNFTEAFNVIGLALGVQPASVKNYRDEFDPLFPNERQGWHKREIRKYCKDIYDTFHALNLVNFSSLLKDIIYKDHDLDVLMEEIAKSEGERESSFAKRLITGQAAEQYFKDNFLSVDIFNGYNLEDTTKIGCGFDFKLTAEEKERYFGVEVKGLNESSGNIALTNKEHAVADFLKNRYFIFVVKNFKEKPFHQIYQDPIKNLSFNRIENKVVQISWNTKV